MRSILRQRSEKEWLGGNRWTGVLKRLTRSERYIRGGMPGKTGTCRFRSRCLAWPTLISMVWLSTFCLYPSSADAGVADGSLSCTDLGMSVMGRDRIIDQLGAHDFDPVNVVAGYHPVTLGERAGLVYTNEMVPIFSQCDLTVDGRFPIRIIRTYNGDNNAVSSYGLGNNWFPNVFRKVTTKSDDRTVRLSSSRTLAFILDSQNLLQPNRSMP